MDGSDVQLITGGLTKPWGIEVHNNDIYFTEYSGNLYKQSKSPGSSKILIHSDTPSMFGVKVYQKYIRTYNVIKLCINTLVSSLSVEYKITKSYQQWLQWITFSYMVFQLFGRSLYHNFIYKFICRMTCVFSFEVKCTVN